MSCPEPFVAKNKYPELGGDIDARFCTPILTDKGFLGCCLPCPRQSYFYTDTFQKFVHGTTYVNLASVVCCCFLLLSFAILRVEYTHRHYLSVCLTFAILLMQLSFIIPLGNPETQCYDEITPHDMYSSMNCAISGAFLLGGGWSTVTWVFLRTLSLHLQICWQVVPGRRFFLLAQVAGWSIPIIFLAVALSITGVSFRFGESCHINSRNGLQTFWGPLLAVAAGSIVTQTITFGYCIQVYLRSLFEEKQGTSHVSSGSALPYSNSVQTVTAAQALRRVRRVVALQWRGIFVVIIILTDVVFFATVFLQFDGTTQLTRENFKHAAVWIGCILDNDGDKNKCLDIAKNLVVSEGTALAVLFLLSMNGMWALLLLGRPSIFRGWYETTKRLLIRKRTVGEFASYDARRVSHRPESSYEMLGSKQHDIIKSNLNRTVKAPEPTVGPIHLGTNSLREYNPSTYSAQLRERADSNTYLSSAACIPCGESYALRSLLVSPPFSRFKDQSENILSESEPAGHGQARHVRSSSMSEAGTVASLSIQSYAADNTGTPSSEPSPRFPGIEKFGGTDIGIAK